METKINFKASRIAETEATIKQVLDNLSKRPVKIYPNHKPVNTGIEFSMVESKRSEAEAVISRIMKNLSSVVAESVETPDLHKDYALKKITKTPKGFIIRVDNGLYEKAFPLSEFSTEAVVKVANFLSANEMLIDENGYIDDGGHRVYEGEKVMDGWYDEPDYDDMAL